MIFIWYKVYIIYNIMIIIVWGGSGTCGIGSPQRRGSPAVGFERGGGPRGGEMPRAGRDFPGRTRNHIVVRITQKNEIFSEYCCTWRFHCVTKKYWARNRFLGWRLGKWGGVRMSFLWSESCGFGPPLPPISVLKLPSGGHWISKNQHYLETRLFFFGLWWLR